jgi:hypothetical protein
MQHSNARYAACERICSGRSQLLPGGNMAQQRLQFLSLHCLMRPLAAPHLKRDLSYDADLPNLVFQHPIGFHRILPSIFATVSTPLAGTMNSNLFPGPGCLPSGSR